MTTTNITPHRFFRAMVLMGGSLALGCGGQSLDPDGTSGGSGAMGGDGSGATGGGSGSSGSASGGTTSGATGGTSGTSGTGDTGGTSGNSSSGTGGDTSSGGSMIDITGGASGTAGATSSGGTGTATGGGPAAGGAMPAGGTTSVGGSVATGGSAGCSMDQLSCGVPDCSFDGTGYQMPADCRCDETKPLSGSQCASGRRVCREASADAQGNPYPAPVAFDCVCAQDPNSCNTSCQQAFPEGDGHDCTDPLNPKLLPADPVVPSDLLCGCSFVFLK